jgi:CAAX prenyl protease-like protein
LSTLSVAVPRPSTGAASRILPFAVLVGLVALAPLLHASRWADALDARWTTVARGVVVGAILVALWPRFTELRPLRLAMPHALVAVGAGLAVFALWIVLDRGWAVMGTHAGGFVPLDAEGHFNPLLFFLRLAGFALAVPVAEELFWRSFLLRWIDHRRFLDADPRAASAKAFAICSVLFALEHSQWLAGLAAGMIYTGLYTRTGNLWAPIVSHAITNATLGIFILATGRWALW